MGQTMELTKETLETIGEYVRENLADWIRAINPPPQQTEPLLLERIVRVEEELRAGRELMKQGFDQIDRRMEDLRSEMNARFEQVDRRFEGLRTDANARFDEASRHMNRWMTAMTLVLALVGIAVTLAQIFA